MRETFKNGRINLLFTLFNGGLWVFAVAMGIVVFPVLLMASSIAAGSSAAETPTRVQAVASATIISGEAVSFEQAGFHSVRPNMPKAEIFELPLARSAQSIVKTDQEDLLLIEFY